MRDGSNTSGARAYQTDFEREHAALMQLPPELRHFLEYDADESYGAENALAFWRQTRDLPRMLRRIREISREAHLNAYPGITA